MSAPRPIGEAAAAALVAAEKARAKMAAWALTPEGRAHIAHVAATLAARARRELAALADERDVPAEPQLRAVALAPEPPATAALRFVRGALDWRTRNAVDGRLAPCVRVLGGNPGVGKSCALAWAVAHHPRPARFVAAADVLATPRNGYSTNEERWQLWERVDLLALDEAGMEAGDPALLVLLLARRYNLGGATLVATNLDRAAFEARFPLGDRLTDRLVNGQGHAGEKTGLKWYVPLRGESLRNPAARAALTGETK